MAFLIRWLLRLALAGPLALGAVGGIAAPTPVATPVATPTPTPTSSTAPTAPRGADVSWPNCPKGEGIPSRRGQGQPMPKPSARFVAVGVTNGPGFYRNPCLGSELSWVARHHRQLGGYAVTTYPTGRQVRKDGQSGPYALNSRLGQIRNAGYAEATFNLRTMAHVGMQVPMIWVDVEPYATAPWTRHRAANRAVVNAAIHAYRTAGYRVGIYTYAYGWHQVVGAWRLRSIPTWSTTGHGNPHQALALCTHGVSGGPTWLAQWWRGPKRDLDLVCPAAMAGIFSRQ